MPVWVIVLLSGFLFFTLSMFIAIRMCKGVSGWSWETEDTIETICTVLCVISFFGTAIATPLVGIAEQEYYEIQYENIYSVRGTNNDLEGNFFLGTGSIDETTYYMVFVEDNRGYKLEKYNSMYTHIVEVDDGHYYTVRYKEKWSMNDEYILYVPEGTIFVEYRI